MLGENPRKRRSLELRAKVARGRRVGSYRTSRRPFLEPTLNSDRCPISGFQCRMPRLSPASLPAVRRALLPLQSKSSSSGWGTHSGSPRSDSLGQEF